MRLLKIGNFGRSWDGSVADEEHIASAFESLGWVVGRFQREDTLKDEWPEFHPDLILIAQWNGLGQHTLQRLWKEYPKVPIVYFAYDYQWDSNENWHLELAKGADLFLSKELDHKADYEAMGVKFQWFSQDFAPQFLDKSPAPRPTKDIDVLFTGSYLPQATFRNDLLKAVDEQFDLHVYTVTKDEFTALGLKNVYAAKVDNELPELYARAKINLSCDWKQAEGYWSDRVAQILCCGGFVLNKYVPLQESILRTSMMYFDTIDQAVHCIENLLPNDAFRDRVAEYGYRFAQSHLKVNSKVAELIVLLAGKGI